VEVNLPNFSDDASLVHCPVGMKDVWMTLVGDKVAQSLFNLKVRMIVVQSIFMIC